jgi:hypothetical protein
MSRVVLENDEFLVEDAEGVSFNVPGNNGRYTLARRFTEKQTGRAFYVDRKSTEIFESHDGGLIRVTDAALRDRLDKQRDK